MMAYPQKVYPYVSKLGSFVCLFAFLLVHPMFTLLHPIESFYVLDTPINGSHLEVWPDSGKRLPPTAANRRHRALDVKCGCGRSGALADNQDAPDNDMPDIVTEDEAVSDDVTHEEAAQP
ncbi:unnamed protein product [Camellia sinensis]